MYDVENESNLHSSVKRKRLIRSISTSHFGPLFSSSPLVSSDRGGVCTVSYKCEWNRRHSKIFKGCSSAVEFLVAATNAARMIPRLRRSLPSAGGEHFSLLSLFSEINFEGENTEVRIENNGERNLN